MRMNTSPRAMTRESSAPFLEQEVTSLSELAISQKAGLGILGRTEGSS